MSSKRDKNLLWFSYSNSKMIKLSKALNKKVYAFDLPAGWSCPAANICLSKAHKQTGKIKDGPHALFRCYAASLEAVYPAVRQLRWHNFERLKNTSNMYNLIQSSLPSDLEILRLHSSGDFFNQDYFTAWLKVIGENPKIVFYGYTKRADLFVNLTIPGNLHFVQSHGGKLDQIDTGLPTSYVVDSPNGHKFPVYSTDEQSELHILSDRGGDFGLLIHGVQPKGFKGIDKSKRTI